MEAREQFGVDRRDRMSLGSPPLEARNAISEGLKESLPPERRALRLRRNGRPTKNRSMPGETDALGVVRQRERTYRRALAISDMVAAAWSVYLAINLIGGLTLRPAYLIVMPIIVIAAKLQGLYDRDELVLAKKTLDELPKLLNLATLFALVLWLSRHVIINGAPNTSDLLALWLLLATNLTVSRMLARRVAGAASPVERCFVLGDVSVYRRLRAKLNDFRDVELLGSVSFERISQSQSALAELVAERDIQRIIIAPNEALSGDDMVQMVRAAKATGLRVSLLPSILVAVGSSVAFDDVGGVTLLGVPRFGLSRSSAVLKRGFDLAFSGILLVITAPFLAMAALLIKFDSPGPVLFRQVRVGRDNAQFTMLKLRTMVADADAMKPGLREFNECDGLFKIAADPRITRVGRWLRCSHLDELPQLINVLRGEMSVVGPRPLVLDEDERVTGYDRRRLQLTPGMTGQWQVLGSARVPLSEMVKLDYLYVANWSLWGDVKILARTMPVVLQRRGQ